MTTAHGVGRVWLYSFWKEIQAVIQKLCKHRYIRGLTRSRRSRGGSCWGPDPAPRLRSRQGVLRAFPNRGKKLKSLSTAGWTLAERRAARAGPQNPPHSNKKPSSAFLANQPYPGLSILGLILP